MPTPTNIRRIILSFCLFAILTQTEFNAQIVIGTPNLGFSQACANEDFNTFSTTFIFSPETGLYPTNQFSIELSDSDGDFSNAEVIYTSSPGSVTVSPATLQFAIPETAAGENYKIRIKSSAPVATSSGSISFSAYYKPQDAPFTINNLVSTGAFCSGGSYLLSIDNPGTGNNDSPLLYPNLNFKWYRETSPTTSEFVADGNTLEVTSNGTYFVETDYGSCTSDSFSNRVTITEVVSGEANATIVSSLGNPYCPGEGTTTLSTMVGLSYQWYKDGVLIDGATSQMYNTNESGIFAVQVDLGDCSAYGTIDLVSELFDSSIDVAEEVDISEGDFIIVNITDNAQNPEYAWYLDGNLIPDATEPSFQVEEFGDYTATITENSGCSVTIEYYFTVVESLNLFPDIDNIPNVISPNGDGINDTWIIPQDYVQDSSNTEVVIMNNKGKIVLKTNAYQNNWPQNELNLNSVNQVYYYVITTEDNKTKKGSITVVK
ncbi:T9SS type B sorting domain-containing protein [Winogradskyella endarachnes]|uniref:T9SS type B sorting domain-containing protein n=1 Tax=Winogradskyella endarachnes TaxID=2681965 RepID=A0A6L6U4X1_9FLAO|nr:gliding motility-associated C-terminal domain-containing protein [Winogradskyella endarachnes]MUU77038.1 T9SS type B sorting domain-containing protein [Winogradskyella endarachnes]